MTERADTFSWATLAVLATITAASGAMFYLNARRWTTRKRAVELAEWADANGFKLRREGNAPLPVAVAAAVGSARLRWWMTDDTGVGLFELWPVEPHEVGAPLTGRPRRWHLLIAPLADEWRATGLRPAHAARSLLDALALPGHPGLGAAQRFVLHGTDAVSAARLARSQVRALLPADVGLLLAGRQMMLDFSDRPFDGIELGRMVGLGKQLVERMPGGGSPKSEAGMTNK